MIVCSFWLCVSACVCWFVRSCLCLFACLRLILCLGVCSFVRFVGRSVGWWVVRLFAHSFVYVFVCLIFGSDV